MELSGSAGRHPFRALLLPLAGTHAAPPPLRPHHRRLHRLARDHGRDAGVVDHRGLPYHWAVLTGGSVLLGLLIVGLTFQLAHALGERNYSRRQEEFVSNITHEMKSPLAAIKLHAQTLQQVGPDDEQPRSLRPAAGGADGDAGRQRPRKRPAGLAQGPYAAGTAPLRTGAQALFRRGAACLDGRGWFAADVDTDAMVMATTTAASHHHQPDRECGALLDRAARSAAACSTPASRLYRGRGRRHRHSAAELNKVFDRFYQIGREI